MLGCLAIRWCPDSRLRAAPRAPVTASGRGVLHTSGRRGEGSAQPEPLMKARGPATPVIADLGVLPPHRCAGASTRRRSLISARLTSQDSPWAYCRGSIAGCGLRSVGPPCATRSFMSGPGKPSVTTRGSSLEEQMASREAEHPARRTCLHGEDSDTSGQRPPPRPGNPSPGSAATRRNSTFVAAEDAPRRMALSS